MLRLKDLKHLFYSANRDKLRQIFSRQYCDNKDQDRNKCVQGKKTEEKLKAKISDSQTLVVNISDELNEKDDALPLTERERDANVTGKLSKETERLIGRKIPLTSTGLNLCLEIIKDKPPVMDGIDIDILKKMEKRPIPILDPPSKKIPRGEDEPPRSRIIRGEPGKVVIGFVPKEWIDFFIPKTGVTGFYTFLLTFGTYLVSKEIYVLEHNFYNGLGMIITVWGSIKFVGPQLAKYLDEEIDKLETGWNQNRVEEKKMLHESVEQELLLQYQIEGQIMLVEAKRENVALQLEEEFRKRQMMVYEEVKKLLDYQVRVEQIHDIIRHKNLVHYVQKEVLKSITPDMEKQLINISIDGLLADLQKKDK